MQIFEKPKIWIDADSCPVRVRDLILRTAVKKQLNVIFVANKPIPFTIKSPLFEMHIEPQIKDAADNYIVENCASNDIVITRDMLLADRLVQKQIVTLNDRGIKFDKRTVEKMLKERELSLNMELLGLHTGKMRYSYGNKEFSAFEKCFSQALSEKLCYFN